MAQAETSTPELIERDDTAVPKTEGVLSALLILLVLLLGATFRFTGLNWDQGTHLHPDERFLTGVATQIQPVSDFFTYLRTSESSLNPYNVGQGFYVYGNFPMTVTRIVADWVKSACATLSCSYNYTAYDGVHLLGRALSGLMDLIAILFLFLIGRRLYNWRVGVLAAFFQAIAVMPIQQSHFFTMDNWAASLSTIAVYTAVRAAGFGEKKDRWQVHWWLLFGLSLGLAAASRINIAPLAGLAPLAAMLWLIKQGHTRVRDWFQFNHLDAQSAFIGVALAAAMSILTFRIAQPYAFADAQIAREEAIAATGEKPGVVSLAIRSLIGFNPQWRDNMAEIQRLQQPEASLPFALQ
ncbi:MAG: ArnT family glycosyltransferase, partial [Anaerolineae bacterium]